MLWVNHPQKIILDKPLLEMKAADNYSVILAKCSVFLNQVNLNLLSPVAKPSWHNVLGKFQNFL